MKIVIIKVAGPIYWTLAMLPVLFKVVLGICSFTTMEFRGGGHCSRSGFLEETQKVRGLANVPRALRLRTC